MMSKISSVNEFIYRGSENSIQLELGTLQQDVMRSRTRSLSTITTNFSSKIRRDDDDDDDVIGRDKQKNKRIDRMRIRFKHIYHHHHHQNIIIFYYICCKIVLINDKLRCCCKYDIVKIVLINVKLYTVCLP